LLIARFSLYFDSPGFHTVSILLFVASQFFLQVYKENGGVAPDQGDAMFSEIKRAVNGYRNYMRDQNLFWDATGDMSWLDMLKFVYNGSAVSVTYTDADGASRTIGNAGTYSTWTSTQILNSYMFNYQLNTGTVRLHVFSLSEYIMFLMRCIASISA
jgi:hypothetical protein